MPSRTSPSRSSSILRRTSKRRSRPRKRAASFVQLLYSSMIPAYLALGWQKTPKRSFSPCPRFWRTTGQIPFLPKLISCATGAKIMNVQSACSRRGRDDLLHLVRAAAHALRDIIKNTPLYVHKYPTLCTQVPHFMYINTPLCAYIPIGEEWHLFGATAFRRPPRRRSRSKARQEAPYPRRF